jgi:hypothetical protein
VLRAKLRGVKAITREDDTVTPVLPNAYDAILPR